MTLTENQCEELRDAILDLYPYKEKADLESFLSEKINVKLELIVAYSGIIPNENLKESIGRNKKKQIRKILVFKTTSSNLQLDQEFLKIKSVTNSNRLNFILQPFSSHTQISQEIENQNPQIVHFCCHGLENGSLELENDNVSPQRLSQIIEISQDNIVCVFFNACNSAKAAEVISQQIDYVIGMEKSIADEVAIEFAKAFYGALVRKKNNQDRFLSAFNQGIVAITNNDKSLKAKPILYKKINYNEAILNLLKKLDTENKIDDFINELKKKNFGNSLLLKFISYYKHPLKEYGLNEFKEIIKGIDNDSVIKSAYQKIFPDEIESADKNKIIDKLVTSYYGEQPSSLSIVKFAHNLATILQKNQNNQFQSIRDWLNQIPDEFKIKIPTRDKNKSISEQFYTYLLITVDEQDNNKFHLRAEYILENENFQRIKHESLNLTGCNQETGIICNSFNEISHHVKKYHEELYNQLSADELKDITIELFLPMQYLRQNLDKEWYCDDGFGGSTPIVRECNLIVRPSNRIQKKSFLIPLQNNFQRFKQQLSRYSDEDILNEEIEIINQKVDRKNFQKISDNFKEKKIGIKLTHKDIPDTAFFQAMIRGAAAIAFWERTASSDDKNLDDIDNYLKLDFFQHNFRNLIQQMHNQRKKASNDEQIYSIGFLVDNPNRIPTFKYFQRNI